MIFLVVAKFKFIEDFQTLFLDLKIEWNSIPIGYRSDIGKKSCFFCFVFGLFKWTKKPAIKDCDPSIISGIVNCCYCCYYCCCVTIFAVNKHQFFRIKTIYHHCAINNTLFIRFFRAINISMLMFCCLLLLLFVIIDIFAFYSWFTSILCEIKELFFLFVLPLGGILFTYIISTNI